MPLAAIAALLGTLAFPPRADPRPGVRAEVRALADTILAGLTARFPEIVTYFGVPGRADDLSDNSAAAERRWRAQEDAWLARARRVDAATLRGSPEWRTYGLLRAYLETDVATRACEARLWTVTPVAGIFPDAIQFAYAQPTGTDARRRDALTRWALLPARLDTEVANLREGLRRGYAAPRSEVERLVSQLDQMLAAPDTASPFYAPARADTSAAFRDALARLQHDAIRPALRRYRDYLTGPYRAAARTSATVRAVPGGARCYRAEVYANTTLPLDPAAIDATVRRQLDSLERSLTTFTTRRFDTADWRAVVRRLYVDSGAGTFRSRAEALDSARSLVRTALAVAPRVVSRLPGTPLVAEPFSALQEPTAPYGTYVSGDSAHGRPGVFYVNLALATAPGGRLQLPDLVFHESAPGHYLQIERARQLAGAHPLDVPLGTAAGTAFVEGWAIYAARLPLETGAWRASAADSVQALVLAVENATLNAVETGMHVRGWTRDQAIAFETAHSARPPERVARDVDRRIGMRGQGLAYGIGTAEILRLRGAAARALGPAFDLRAFDDELLADGSVTLPMLREKVARWLAARR